MWGPRAVCRWTWSPWCSPSWPSGGLIYGLSSIGQILAGGSAAVVALSVTGVGAVALVLFALRQIRRARTGEVLLDLRPLAVRGFTLPIIVLLILFGAMLGVMNTLPLYLQGSLLATARADGANSAFLTSAGLVGIALVLSLFMALHNSGCRCGLNPPASRSARAM